MCLLSIFSSWHADWLSCTQRGDYLIVGVHGDAVVNRTSGRNLPLMNLHERVLSVLGCRYVDDVLIDAPYEITEDVLDSLAISEVICVQAGDEKMPEPRFHVAQERRILYPLKNSCDFSMASILQRIQHNQDMFQARFECKSKAEQSFYKEKRQANGNSLSNGH